MKKFVFFGVLLVSINSLFSQNQYKYQVYFNAIPININNYSSTYRVGIEKLSRKWNYHIDLSSHYIKNSIVEYVYTQDSSLYMGRDFVRWSTTGLNFGISKVLLQKDSRRLLIGSQLYAGINQYLEISNTLTTDKQFLSVSQTTGKDEINVIRWRENSDYSLIKRGNHLSFGLALNVKYEFELFKRWTFAPSIVLPYLYHNETNGYTSSIEPGFSFNLGYRFGKFIN